ncbi:hypothetical protein ABZV15_41695, partial [Streptomyces sp. NPDC005246]|uniref:hypothetical protein n=1 Tax=Streptomyces sp. NPDC005246 TaxID=3156716 RepID=UPI0033AB6418
DNVAVTGYDVYRNGVLAGSATTRAFTDQGLAMMFSQVRGRCARRRVGDVTSWLVRGAIMVP